MGAVALHGGHGVVHDQGGTVAGHRSGVVDQHRPGAARPRRGHVVVAVAARRAHGDEEVARLDESGVEAEPLEPRTGSRAAPLESGDGRHQVVEVDHRVRSTDLNRPGRPGR